MTTRASESETLIREQITELDTSGNEVKTFEGGCQHLLRWYRRRVAELSCSTDDGSDGDSTSCSSSASSVSSISVDTDSDYSIGSYNRNLLRNCRPNRGSSQS